MSSQGKVLLDSILEYYPEEEILIAYGFDQAVIGIEPNSMRLIYSIPKAIGILTEDMPEEDATEYLYYNTINAYVGEKTPIWCVDSID